MGTGQYAVVFLAISCVSGALQNYAVPPYSFSLKTPQNSYVHKPCKSYNIRRTVKTVEPYSLDGFSRKLKSQELPVSQEKMTLVGSQGAPARSVKELEELMRHPVWITDTSKKKPQEPSMLKNNRIYAVPAASVDQSWLSKAVSHDQQDHIREIITKFQTYKPRPITDNRITKFIFTHDGDFATSRTVQEHNREVEQVFADFNKKLEEMLSSKGKKKGENKQDVQNEPDLGQTYNRVVHFLEKNINKLKDESNHRQVCSKHHFHSKGVDYDLSGNEQQFAPLKPKELKKLSDIVQTRDGLESVLLGLDHPRSGPFKRQAVLPRHSGH